MDAQQIMDIIAAWTEEHGCSGYWGIRGLCDDEDYAVGDEPRESYDWDVEQDCSTRDTTGETIGGTCAVAVHDAEDVVSIQAALDGAGLYAGPSGRMALIHADHGEYGNDPDEIILQGGVFDAVEVVAVWEVE